MTGGDFVTYIKNGITHAKAYINSFGNGNKWEETLSHNEY